MKFIKIQNSAKAKVFRTVKSTDYGMVENGAIFVNVEKIWNMAKGFNYFVKELNTTCTHEQLHILIGNELGDSTAIVGEEKTVRKLTYEKWNKKLQKQYLEDENAIY